MICLDTSLLVDLLKQREEAINKVNSLKGELLATTRINIFEVFLGFFSGGSANEKFRNDVKMLIDRVEVLELDEISAIKAAEIASSLVKKGEEIGHSDAIIAGIMLAHGCNRIATRDIHFKRIKELKAEGY